MDARTQDGTAADVGPGPIARRPRPDPRIARFVAEALDGARTVLDVGAGVNSQEGAADGAVTAVGGSGPGRARRPALPARAVDAVAGDLPYADGEFDASMTLFDVHQWSDVTAGLREMRRVTRGPVVVLARAPELVRDFWLGAYAPEVLETEARRHPPVRDLTAALGGTGRVRAVPIPLDCTDGFDEAYYGRPEMLLDPAARQACSAWSFVGDEVREHFDRTLRRDLASGAWDRRFGHLRTEPVYEGSLVLVRAIP
ncbi:MULTISPECIES: methyltransferase domain-containing protein [unclassified Streptomyces]|uniref:class I SAM-dependent methyltransferase n=1 Tax=unclassified Streptomyces TaxID=2593676 RepID=UPI0001C1AC7A|nr:MULTISPECIES: methyltransferase domain-containing protein [unclassified Streptomyces]AEN14129.1 methylase involved in ubiquinone/menaquinone biosynthesis [Streptomyces sp. SirexAA-E]MYR66845.1 SAM-dependent methyltransferase [Streptomyces sp. SID4939]MYT66059.1 SAM-dependent methyltransferase [Streptomyces sp. SID8357]MYT88865.1 SAM-dependent methyltransferase [Streptomyces sp. SID8360]MYW41576.1 SAM-dependent methyltransferase [Streptomyces sp. SID1]